MRVLGTLNFNIEPTGDEAGNVVNGNYQVYLASANHKNAHTITLAKNGANVVVGLGGLTTVKFIHVKAVFVDDTVADATIELLINDGAGERTMTGTEFMLVNTDITSIKLTNNSHDTTGSDAKVFIELAGD